MKRINLARYQEPDKTSIVTKRRKYSIHLGNGTTLYYTTSKDLHFAMAEINRQLNAVLFELNEMFINSFAEYRRLWFYLPNETWTSIDVNIKQNHADISRLFGLIIDRSSWINGCVFSFKWLFSVISSLIAVNEILLDVRKKRKQGVESRLIELQIEKLRIISQNLQEMGIDSRYSPISAKYYHEYAKNKNPRSC